MKNNSRQIQFFDLTMVGKTRAKNLGSVRAVPPKNLEGLMLDSSKLSEDNKAFQLRTNAGTRVEYKLQDYRDEPDFYVLLINVVDTGAATPVTQKIAGTELDRERGTINQQRGLESSAHVLISKVSDSAGKYLTLFEKNTNLGFGDVRRFLNHIAAKASQEYLADYQKPHPNGSGRKIRFFCHLEFLGHPSNDFMNDLANGKFTDVSITIGLDEIKAFDSTKQPELKAAELKVSIDGAFVQAQGGNKGFFGRARSLAQEVNGDLIRLKFLDEQENSHSAEIDPGSGYIKNDDRYVRKGAISDFANRLATSHTQIDDLIVKKMIELV